MRSFQHLRHQPPTPLERPRELVIVCPSLRSNVNLSRIVRVAGCAAVPRVITIGKRKVDPEIARDALEVVAIESHRSLPPVLKKLKSDDYELIGLEQTTHSQCLWDAKLPRRMALVLGHEREGISEEVLALLDSTVEIPVYGQPASYNVATAATMAIYEYCRQYPKG